MVLSGGGGSHIIQVLRQGVWASLTGGWFYDPRQAVIANVLHLYLWMFLMSFPLLLQLCFSFSSSYVIFGYVATVMATFLTIKSIVWYLHRIFDKFEYCEEEVDRSANDMSYRNAGVDGAGDIELMAIPPPPVGMLSDSVHATAGSESEITLDVHNARPAGSFPPPSSKIASTCGGGSGHNNCRPSNSAVLANEETAEEDDNEDRGSTSSSNYESTGNNRSAAGNRSSVTVTVEAGMLRMPNGIAADRPASPCAVDVVVDEVQAGSPDTSARKVEGCTNLWLKRLELSEENNAAADSAAVADIHSYGDKNFVKTACVDDKFDSIISIPSYFLEGPAHALAAAVSVEDTSKEVPGVANAYPEGSRTANMRARLGHMASAMEALLRSRTIPVLSSQSRSTVLSRSPRVRRHRSFEHGDECAARFRRKRLLLREARATPMSRSDGDRGSSWENDELLRDYESITVQPTTSRSHDDYDLFEQSGSFSTAFDDQTEHSLPSLRHDQLKCRMTELMELTKGLRLKGLLNDELEGDLDRRFGTLIDEFDSGFPIQVDDDYRASEGVLKRCKSAYQADSTKQRGPRADSSMQSLRLEDDATPIPASWSPSSLQYIDSATSTDLGTKQGLFEDGNQCIAAPPTTCATSGGESSSASRHSKSETTGIQHTEDDSHDLSRYSQTRKSFPGKSTSSDDDFLNRTCHTTKGLIRSEMPDLETFNNASAHQSSLADNLNDQLKRRFDIDTDEIMASENNISSKGHQFDFDKFTDSYAPKTGRSIAFPVDPCWRTGELAGPDGEGFYKSSRDSESYSSVLSGSVIFNNSNDCKKDDVNVPPTSRDSADNFYCKDKGAIPRTSNRGSNRRRKQKTSDKRQTVNNVQATSNQRNVFHDEEGTPVDDVEYFDQQDLEQIHCGDNFFSEPLTKLSDDGHARLVNESVVERAPSSADVVDRDQLKEDLWKLFEKIFESHPEAIEALETMQSMLNRTRRTATAGRSSTISSMDPDVRHSRFDSRGDPLYRLGEPSKLPGEDNATVLPDPTRSLSLRNRRSGSRRASRGTADNLTAQQKEIEEIRERMRRGGGGSSSLGFSAPSSRGASVRPVRGLIPPEDGGFDYDQIPQSSQQQAIISNLCKRSSRSSSDHVVARTISSRHGNSDPFYTGRSSNDGRNRLEEMIAGVVDPQHVAPSSSTASPGEVLGELPLVRFGQTHQRGSSRSSLRSVICGGSGNSRPGSSNEAIGSGTSRGGPGSPHIATTHEDTSDGAVHCFQDEAGKWWTYTFSEKGMEIAQPIEQCSNLRSVIGSGFDVQLANSSANRDRRNRGRSSERAHNIVDNFSTARDETELYRRIASAVSSSVHRRRASLESSSSAESLMADVPSSVLYPGSFSTHGHSLRISTTPKHGEEVDAVGGGGVAMGSNLRLASMGSNPVPSTSGFLPSFSRDSRTLGNRMLDRTAFSQPVGSMSTNHAGGNNIHVGLLGLGSNRHRSLGLTGGHRDSSGPSTEIIELGSDVQSSHHHFRPGGQFGEVLDTSLQIASSNGSASSLNRINFYGMIAGAQVEPKPVRKKQFYQIPLKLLPFLPDKLVKLRYDRLQLLTLFDRNRFPFSVATDIVLALLVALVSSLVLARGYYHDVWLILFCVNVAGAQFSLLRSVQPDAASPVHGYNWLLAYSRAVYLLIAAGAILAIDCGRGELKGFWDGEPKASMNVPAENGGVQIALYNVVINTNAVLDAIKSSFLIGILAFPIIFTVGLLPQVNTFAMHVLEHIDMLVFGGTATQSLLSAVFAVFRSILSTGVLTLLAVYGPFATLSGGASQVWMAAYLGLLTVVSYLLSRSTSRVALLYDSLAASVPNFLLCRQTGSPFMKCWIPCRADSVCPPSPAVVMGGVSTSDSGGCAGRGSTNSKYSSLGFSGVAHGFTSGGSSLIDPLPEKLRSTIMVRLKADIVTSLFIFAAIFALHCSTIFISFQPFLTFLLACLAASVGFLLHYVWPQLRKHNPWLLVGRPILRAHDLSLFDDSESSQVVMWFERFSVWVGFVERNLLYPLLVVSAVAEAGPTLETKHGRWLTGFLVSVAGIKLLRTGFANSSQLYLPVIAALLLFKVDLSGLSETFLVDFFLLAVLYSKFQELLLKLRFVFVYVAPWQITWGSAFHAFAQPFGVPHAAFLMAQTFFSSIISAPLNPFLGSALFIMSYVRPVKFWEKDYNTRRIDNSNTRLINQIDRCAATDDDNLNSIFYEHLTRSLQTYLSGDMMLGRWSTPLAPGDCFILASYYLNCLVHIIEVGNGFITFQLRGLEFRGTYCQQREVEAITEDASESSACCCCEPGRIPGLLSFNTAWNLRWLAWEVSATKYILEGYSITDNSAASMLQVYELRKLLVTLYVRSIIYYTFLSPKLESWLCLEAVDAVLEMVGEDAKYADVDPVFNSQIDEDYDIRLNGISKSSFLDIYLPWIQFCAAKRQAKAGCEGGIVGEIDCSETSMVASLCFCLSLVGRRTLGVASHIGGHKNVESFLYGLHALFKGDFKITSPRDEWVFADMDFLLSVISPAIRMALKLHQEHFAAPNEYDDEDTLFDAIHSFDSSLFISHEGDPAWRQAVLANVPSLLALRHIFDDGTDEYKIIRLQRRYLHFRVIKLNRECVRGLWAGQQQELIFLRNRNPERGSIQNARQVLRNMINSSADQPIGYPIYVSPLTTSFCETHPQLRSLLGPPLTFAFIKRQLGRCWSRLREHCGMTCSSNLSVPPACTSFGPLSASGPPGTAAASSTPLQRPLPVGVPGPSPLSQMATTSFIHHTAVPSTTGSGSHLLATRTEPELGERFTFSGGRYFGTRQAPIEFAGSRSSAVDSAMMGGSESGGFRETEYVAGKGVPSGGGSGNTLAFTNSDNLEMRSLHSSNNSCTTSSVLKASGIINVGRDNSVEIPKSVGNFSTPSPRVQRSHTHPVRRLAPNVHSVYSDQPLSLQTDNFCSNHALKSESESEVRRRQVSESATSRQYLDYDELLKAMVASSGLSACSQSHQSRPVRSGRLEPEESELRAVVQSLGRVRACNSEESRMNTFPVSASAAAAALNHGRIPARQQRNSLPLSSGARNSIVSMCAKLGGMTRVRLAEVDGHPSPSVVASGSVAGSHPSCSSSAAVLSLSTSLPLQGFNNLYQPSVTLPTPPVIAEEWSGWEVTAAGQPKEGYSQKKDTPRITSSVSMVSGSRSMLPSSTASSKRPHFIRPAPAGEDAASTAAPRKSSHRRNLSSGSSSVASVGTAECRVPARSLSGTGSWAADIKRRVKPNDNTRDLPKSISGAEGPLIDSQEEVRVVDLTCVFRSLNRIGGRGFPLVPWPTEAMRKTGGQSYWSSKGWEPCKGMKGPVVHRWIPCHPLQSCRSHIDKVILLVLLEGIYYVPIAESGVEAIDGSELASSGDETNIEHSDTDDRKT